MHEEFHMSPTVSSPFNRRHSRWYERILFSLSFQFLLGYLIVILLPNYFYWGNSVTLELWSALSKLLFPAPNISNQESINQLQINTIALNSFAFLISFLFLSKLKRYPGTQSLSFIIPTLSFAWLGIFTLFNLFTPIQYSSQVFIYSFFLANICSFAGFFIERHYKKLKLALVPYGRALELKNTSFAHTVLLQQPRLGGYRYDGIVADLHASDLPAEWQTFLAECTLAHIPVHHTQQIIESLTGRVRINHLSENSLGTLLPSSTYSTIKRILETVIVLITAPFWLPVMLITGVFIKLESEGPMFFIQERVGQGNRNFNVYKLRSMGKDSEKNGAQFAQANDVRITRVGHFIRKTRIDEIPQFINVLKGEMSLIGPRPEQRAFVNQFEQEIPFYSYRHVVKPGITGWAQVVHGYAADADDTSVKLEHDFYYIKNFSLWLDLLITVRTIHTMLTGFGAR